MKGITILLVVFAHVTRMYTPKGVIKIVSSSAILESITEFIYMFHMPAFVMVSGAVYYFVKRERGKYNNQRGYIHNKVIRLLVPFFFFALLYVLPVLLYTRVENNVLSYVVKDVLLMAPQTHLWYSVMIFNVMVVFHLLESRIFQAKTGIVWAVFIALNLFSYIIPNAFQAMNTLSYLLYFYVGYWFQQNKERVLPVIKSKWALMVFIPLACYYLLFHTVVQDTLLLRKAIQIVAAISGSGLIYLVSHAVSETTLADKEWFENLANDSYGIYLFHPMIIYVLFFWVSNVEHNPYVGTSVIFIITTVLSIFLVKVFRIVGINTLIGEKRTSREAATSKS